LIGIGAIGPSASRSLAPRRPASTDRITAGSCSSARSWRPFSSRHS